MKLCFVEEKCGRVLLQHFLTSKMNLKAYKRSTVNDWKRALMMEWKDHEQGKFESVVELASKKKIGEGRLLLGELADELKAYMHVLRDAGVVINSAIVCCWHRYPTKERS